MSQVFIKISANHAPTNEIGLRALNRKPGNAPTMAQARDEGRGHLTRSVCAL